MMKWVPMSDETTNDGICWGNLVEEDGEWQVVTIIMMKWVPMSDETTSDGNYWGGLVEEDGE